MNRYSPIKICPNCEEAVLSPWDKEVCMACAAWKRMIDERPQNGDLDGEDGKT